MSDEVSIRLSTDPRVVKQIKRLQGKMPDADISQIVRAAILYFAESAPDHQIKVYIQEQIYQEQA